MSDRPWSHQSLLFLHTMLLLLYSINTTGLARPDHFGGSFSNTTLSSNISFEDPSKLYQNSLSCNFQLVWMRYLLSVTDRNLLIRPSYFHLLPRPPRSLRGQFSLCIDRRPGVRRVQRHPHPRSSPNTSPPNRVHHRKLSAVQGHEGGRLL